MRSSKGFTLVELLVVMAIIAILASIVVPNVQKYIVRARLTRAVAEVSGIELAMTAMITDAGRGNFGQMIMKNAVREVVPSDPAGVVPRVIMDERPEAYIGWPSDMSNLMRFDSLLFENAANIYARVAYDVLRLGRNCLLTENTEAIAQYFIQRDILTKLGTNYMDIGLDPWGGVYRVFPGPWKIAVTTTSGGSQRWPIPFRIFTVEQSSGGNSFAVKKDEYVLQTNAIVNMPGIIESDTWPSTASYPAETNKPIFVWSYGENMKSSQMLYQAEYNLSDPISWFNQEEEADIAGGDDVNNWDKGNSWQRFYM